MNKTIMEKIENLKQYFDSLKINLISKIESNPIYAFLKKRREWINASFRNYTLFLLWGSISLATVRFFQM
jgi:hypothetical protein